MLKTNYISNCTENNMDELKTAILFFDQINIIDNVLLQIEPQDQSKKVLDKGDIGVITGIQNFVTENYKEHIKILTEEGYVNIVSDEKREDQLWNNIDTAVNSLMTEDINLLFEKFETETIGVEKRATYKFSDEVMQIHNEFIGPFEVGAKIDFGFIFKYYSSQLSSLLLHISKGEQCLTNSDILNRYLKHYAQNTDFKKLQQKLENDKIIPSLASNAIKLAVPNISLFPFDEVLETKIKAKDELMRFRDELETFQFNLLENYSYQEIHYRSEELIKYKLNPTLVDLKRKIENLNLSIPRKILDEFKDPKSYTPIIGSILGQIPTTIATLLSLGLISISTAYEYVTNRKEIKNNGLYYLIKLNDKFGKQVN